MVEKKGLSPVIATVLLVVVTLVAVAILAAFVVPFVNKNLGSQDCFETLGKVKFADSIYNCNDGTKTGFSIKMEDSKVLGFKAVFYSGGNAEPVEILNGTNGDNLSPNVYMLLSNSNFSNPNATVILPSKGGVRTYVVSGVFDKIELHPILSADMTCEQSDALKDIKKCLDPKALADIGNSR